MQTEGTASQSSMERTEIGQTRKALREAMQRRIDAGLLPNAGRWVERSVLEKEIRRQRAKARVHAFELLLLYAASAIVSLFLLAVFWYLSY